MRTGKVMFSPVGSIIIEMFKSAGNVLTLESRANESGGKDASMETQAESVDAGVGNGQHSDEDNSTLEKSN